MLAARGPAELAEERPEVVAVEARLGAALVFGEVRVGDERGVLTDTWVRHNV